MSPGRDHSDAGSAAAVLGEYRPATALEATDLERALSLVAAVGDPWDRSLPLHLTASALIVHPLTRRVLLRWHERHRSWLHVGGHGDPGETEPLAVAVREAVEETGLEDLSVWPDAALVHLAVVAVPASAREGAHEHVDLRMVLATGHPDRARPESPTAAVRWLSLPDAHSVTASVSLRETLRRLERLLDAYPGPGRNG
jgi:8-oxo-dGTP pyrophosphatase MutT (NUDIX family)